MKSKKIICKRIKKESGNCRMSALDKLAKEQNIKPLKTIEDIEKLSALWPGDEEPEELLNFILEDRKQRRENQKHN